MRITSVDLYSATSEESISFSLGESDPNSQYQVRDIAGLDAEEIIAKFYGSGSVAKPKYYNFEMKPRDIVLRIVLRPRFKLNESYSDIRDELYRAISANRTGMVTLHFNSGGSTISRIFGSIIKFEVPYFVKLPEVQLTVHCNDPMFRAINPVIFSPAELGTVDLVKVPDSLSTAPHGFTMQVTFTAASPSFILQDTPLADDPEWMFKITPPGGFLTGDVLYISTEFSDKKIYMVRGGVTTQLVDTLEPNSIWPIIFPGPNDFYFVTQDKFNWNSLEFYASYWGV